MPFQNGAHMPTLSLIRITKIVCTHLFSYVLLHIYRKEFSSHGGFLSISVYCCCSTSSSFVIIIRLISFRLYSMQYELDWFCQRCLSLMLLLLLLLVHGSLNICWPTIAVKCLCAMCMRVWFHCWFFFHLVVCSISELYM